MGDVLQAFGPFVSVFGKGELDVPAHLELLGMSDPGASIVIDRIELALRAGDTARWVAAMMEQPNWRPHLVGVTAVLLDPSLDASLVWGAIDRRSWVTPQLVVTAALVDPMFGDRARTRVEADGSEGDPKMIASVIAMCAELPELAEWARTIRQDARIEAALVADAGWNRSDHIVAQWLSAVQGVFAARGRPLGRKLGPRLSGAG